MDGRGIVYREIAETLLKNRKSEFVERELARRLTLSPDTVSRAVAPLKNSGSVAMHRRHFEVTNFEKLIAYWAVGRKFERDIVHSTYCEVKTLGEIEGRMPAEIAYTCFTAYLYIFNSSPADYGGVYVYATEGALKEIMLRFPERDVSKRVQGHNLFVLKPDHVLEERIMKGELIHTSVSVPQLYVDLWNNSSWYSYEFLKKTKEKMDDMYEKAILER